MIDQKRLNKITIIAVMATGIHFGTVAGLVYLEELFMVGTILSIVGSYVVATLYLYFLSKIFAVFDNSSERFKILVLGTLAGMLCGILCTTFIYGIMAFIPIEIQKEGIRSLAGDSFIITCGEITGAVAGSVAGGVLTFLYIQTMMETCDEPIKSA